MMKFISHEGRETTLLYDAGRDTFMINGVVYSAGIFGTLGIHGAAIGTTVKIISRNDGTVELERQEDLNDHSKIQK